MKSKKAEAGAPGELGKMIRNSIFLVILLGIVIILGRSIIKYISKILG